MSCVEHIYDPGGICVFCHALDPVAFAKIGVPVRSRGTSDLPVDAWGEDGVGEWRAHCAEHDRVVARLRALGLQGDGLRELADAAAALLERLTSTPPVLG